MGSTNADSSGPQIIQWYIDTRRLWPVPTATPRDEVQGLKTVASRALALLSASEQESVLKYYQVKDAKMSLASHLLKHLIIAKYCGVPWSQTTLSRDRNGKPCFIPTPDQRTSNHVRIDFNVSHQAGIVSLIAAIGFENQVDVGTDVVCVNERLLRDYESIERNGYFDWVDIHAEVFAKKEVSYMKLGPVEVDLGIPGAKILGFGNDALSRCQWRGTQIGVKIVGEDGDETQIQVETNIVIDAKLRRFYAMWCLREAYVKMTGEALLAPWLKQLEMLDVQAPRPNTGITGPYSLEEGEVKKGFKLVFKGRNVTDVQMELTALGSHFMIGGSIRAAKSEDEAALVMGKWQPLNLETDVLVIAESTS